MRVDIFRPSAIWLAILMALSSASTAVVAQQAREPRTTAKELYLDAFVDGSYELGSFSQGEAYDELFTAEEFLAIHPRLRGPVPRPQVLLASPAVVVSLSGLTCRVYDRAGTFSSTYPVGVGVRLKSTGLSITPTGTFSTSRDRNDRWFYIWERWMPEYFAGLPFLRIDARNDQGFHTYGLHGPITDPLKRGYVSHGCVRMRGEDIRELFSIVYAHGATSVTIQQDLDRDAQGKVVEVDYPLFVPGEEEASRKTGQPIDPLQPLLVRHLLDHRLLTPRAGPLQTE